MHHKLIFQRIRGILEQTTAPSYGTCKRCWRPWKYVKPHSVETGPGSGYFEYCEDCWSQLSETKRPRDWSERMGIGGTIAPGTTFVQFIGDPCLTDTRHGQNAFGSVLAEYSNGAHIGVTCEHGGSGWLCLECAQKCVDNQKR